MDALEVAHSITVEAIRAGVNRPDEILLLFQKLTEQANGARPFVAAPAGDDEEPPEPLVAEEPPAGTDEPPAGESAPLPSVAWSERAPEVHEEPPTAHLTGDEIAASHGDDFLKCLECGQTKQQLKQHLRRLHNLSPEQYREKWGLPDDYPTVAPATRRRFQARARVSYEKQKEEGRGIAASPGRKGPRAKKTG